MSEKNDWSAHWRRVHLGRRARFPKVIAKASESTKAVLRTSHTKPVLRDLIERGDAETAESTNFVEALADDMHVSMRAYERALQGLKRLGVVEVVHQHDAKGHRTLSRFRVVDEVLATWVPNRQLGGQDDDPNRQLDGQVVAYPPKTGRLTAKNGPPNRLIGGDYLPIITNPLELTRASRAKGLQKVKDPAGSPRAAGASCATNGKGVRAGAAHSPSAQAEKARGAAASDETAEPVTLAADGSIMLSAAERASWLPDFGNDGRELDLALTQAAVFVQRNGNRPLLAQVRMQLSKMARERRERDSRYQAAKSERPSGGNWKPAAPPGGTLRDHSEPFPKYRARMIREGKVDGEALEKAKPTDKLN
jgi:hypothetical protein